MWPQPTREDGKSLKCHNFVFPEDSGGKYIQTPLQNDLAGALRGTDGEGRLGRTGLRIHWQRTGEEGQIEEVQRSWKDSLVGGWLLSRAGGRKRRLLEPERYQKDAGEGPG